MSVTICLEIIRIHLMRPFFSRSLGVHLPLLPLDLRPLISLYDSLQVHPFRPLQGHCSSSHLLSLLRHQLFPLSGTVRITIQNALISRVLRKRASPDPHTPPWLRGDAPSLPVSHWLPPSPHRFPSSPLPQSAIPFRLHYWSLLVTHPLSSPPRCPPESHGFKDHRFAGSAPNVHPKSRPLPFMPHSLLEIPLGV